MYVWSGKSASMDDKKLALGLAKGLWNEGYNYEDCDICPVDVARKLGSRDSPDSPKKAEKRPDWALFAKLTQHTETILFKEKFLNWPDFGRVIKVKDTNDPDRLDSPPVEISVCLVDMFTKKQHDHELEPDLVIEGTHLGRGRTHFDDELRRSTEISTIELQAWRIFDNTYEEVPEDALGHFYDAETFVYRWKYRVTVTGRDLGGNPSKHAQVGRDRTVYFCWLGERASINEKGAAAILTVELDNESAPQIRVNQGHEPAAFLQLFSGRMVIHAGKQSKSPAETRKLYVTRGEIEHEAALIEVPCLASSLRSRSSFVLLDTDSGRITVWHGGKSPRQTRKIAKDQAKNAHHKLFRGKDELGRVQEVEEAEDVADLEDFFDDSEGCFSLKSDFAYTPRLFFFSSATGTFKMTEILCPHRSENVSPFPFLQSDLYSAVQPGKFDN